jgi:hypothetical protein
MKLPHDCVQYQDSVLAILNIWVLLLEENLQLIIEYITEFLVSYSVRAFISSMIWLRPLAQSIKLAQKYIAV